MSVTTIRNCAGLDVLPERRSRGQTTSSIIRNRAADVAAPTCALQKTPPAEPHERALHA